MKIRILLLLVIAFRAASGQDLSNIGKSPLLKIDGGISANQTWIWDDASGSSQQPYAYTLTANLNFAVYGWAIPLSGMFSNRHWSYQQPFNQFSLNPSYKWIHIYLGYNSMNFSSYTLNGHRFYGGGVELSPPGNWKFSAMGGKMQERILPDSSGRVVPMYLRYGTGFKTEYSFGKGNLGLSTFYAKDMANSLAGYDSLKVSPEENLAMSLNTNFSIMSFLTVSAEYSTSLFTEDTKSLAADQKYRWVPFFNRRLSSRTFQAVKANVSYNSVIGAIGLAYERVDPGFKTLGAYNTVNDFANYTINYAGQLIPEKISLAGSLGLQTDDLDSQKAQKNKRVVGSLNVGFTPVKAVNLNLNYGSFRAYTHVRNGFENINNPTPVLNADTLDFTQITENMGVSLNISPKGTDKIKRNFMLSINYQKASSFQSDNINQANNTFLNGLAGYTQNMVKQNFSFSANFNYNRNKADTIITTMLGPSVSVRKGFLDKKLNTSLSAAVNESLINEKIQNSIFILRTSISYTMKEAHQLDLSAAYSNRNNPIMHTKGNNIMVTLAYRYNFKGKSFN